MSGEARPHRGARQRRWHAKQAAAAAAAPRSPQTATALSGAVLVLCRQVYVRAGRHAGRGRVWTTWAKTKPPMDGTSDRRTSSQQQRRQRRQSTPAAGWLASWMATPTEGRRHGPARAGANRSRHPPSLPPLPSASPLALHLPRERESVGDARHCGGRDWTGGYEAGGGGEDQALGTYGVQATMLHSLTLSRAKTNRAKKKGTKTNRAKKKGN